MTAAALIFAGTCAVCAFVSGCLVWVVMTGKINQIQSAHEYVVEDLNGQIEKLKDDVDDMEAEVAECRRNCVRMRRGGCWED